MKLKDIELLEKADEIMLNLNKYPEDKRLHEISNVGQILKTLNMVKDPNNVNEVLRAYNKSAYNSIVKNVNKQIRKSK